MHDTPTSSCSAMHFASTIAQSFEHTAERKPLSTADRLDHQFMAMQDTYRELGGLARVQEVFTIYKTRHGRDIASLARCIAKREVLSFDWRSQVWIPLFQFDGSDMTLRSGFAAVLASLNPDYGPWSIAMWFAKPNAWLQGATPASVLHRDAAQVLTAARARRLSSI